MFIASSFALIAALITGVSGAGATDQSLEISGASCVGIVDTCDIL